MAYDWVVQLVLTVAVRWASEMDVEQAVGKAVWTEIWTVAHLEFDSDILLVGWMVSLMENWMDDGMVL